MREIKFRGKPLGNGEWIYSNGFYFDGINYWFTLPGEKTNAIGFAKNKIIRVETIGQFTGLKDKDGREIYEGDKIKYSYYKDYGQSGEYEERETIVKWDEEHAGFDPFYYWNSYNYEMEKVEIIGTIHDKEED